MVNKIAFINGKGGCGKTTSIFHVAGVLSKRGEKVLVIDFDKQRNTTDILLMNTQKPTKTVFEFMQGTCSAKDATEKSLFQKRANETPRYRNIDCMTASIQLENENLLKKINKSKFGESLEKFIESQKYTWVLVDMPPSNKELNDICFSYIVDFAIIPFSSDIFSVSGYGDIMDVINDARNNNPNLNILGIFLSRYMTGCGVDKYIKEQLSTFDTFIPVQIPLRTDIREAVMFGRPISYYKTISDSKKAYERLVDEIIKRIELTR